MYTFEGEIVDNKIWFDLYFDYIENNLKTIEP